MRRLLIIFSFLIISHHSVWAYKIQYAEQWYKLFHQHLYRMPEDEAENLAYLEESLKAPFANPLYALARINDKQEWEFYRYLFKLHVNLQIVRTYRQIGMKYDREFVYFFNAPFKRQNLESLEIAEKYYQRALYFWNEALPWVEKANDKRFRWMYLPEIANWRNELRQINESQLDFEKILGQDLSRLEKNRAQFEAMDEDTY
ncbi:MAG: hypothetical protein ACRCVN_03400 [Spirochaetia bacterium]